MAPKTFEELFAGSGIEPQKDENGNIHYNFKAKLKNEAQKTSMQNLIEHFNKVYDRCNEEEKPILASVLNFANESLIKEEKQIIEAHFDGMSSLAAIFNDFLPLIDVMKDIENIKKGLERHEDGEEYYNQRYKNQ